MRFRYLELTPFGCFDNKRIEFADQASFHLLFGQNEAGKSTVLRGILDVLFGVPEGSTDGYLYGNQNLRIGALLQHSSGKELAFRRRKGRKNTFLDPNDTPADESRLLPYLAGLERNVYEQMFGLNHARLREGGRALVASQGALGENLFQAAAGITGLHQLIEQLEEEARQLYRPRASKWPINEGMTRLAQIQDQLRQHTLHPRQYLDLEAAYQQQIKKLAGVEQNMKHLSEEVTKRKRMLRTRTQLGHLKHCRERLEQIGPVPILSKDAPQIRIRTMETIEHAQQLQQSSLEAMRTCQEQEQALVINQKLLTQGANIAAGMQRLEQYRDKLNRRPELLGEIRLLEQSTNILLKEIYPERTLTEIEETRPSLISIESIKLLAEEHEQLMQKQSTIDEKLRKLNKAIILNREKQERLDRALDSRKLRNLVRTAIEKGDPASLELESRQQLLELTSKLEQHLRKLEPWQGSWDELCKLPVPLRETVEDFQKNVEQVQAELAVLTARLAEVHRLQWDKKTQLSTLNLTMPVPSHEDLTQARKHRERGWQLVKQAWLDQHTDPREVLTFTDGQPLSQAYERSVVRADQLSDEMYSKSANIASKTQLEAELLRLGQTISRLEEERRERAQCYENLMHSWEDLWQPCGFVPRAPKEMLAWLKLFAQTLEFGTRVRSLEQEMQITAQQFEDLELKLRNTLTELGTDTNPDETLDQLVSTAEQICSKIDQDAGTLQTLREHETDLTLDLKNAQNDLEELTVALDKWNKQWTQARAALHLPESTLPAVAVSFVQSLERLLSQRDQLKQYYTEEEQIADYLADFEGKIAKLLQDAGYETLDLTPELTLIKLDQAYKQASANLARQEQIRQQLQTHQEAAKQAESTLKRAQEKLQALMKEADVSNIADLERAEERSGEVLELREKIKAIEDALLESGDGLTLSQLILEAEGVDPDCLQAELESIQTRLANLRTDYARQQQEFGALKRDYEQASLGSIDEASYLAEQAQGVLAELEGYTTQYVQIILAKSMLQMGVESYREQHQDPVLARAGELFQQLTLGSFVGLVVDYDSKDNPLILGLRADGERVRVEDMSDGTQDQIYLTLRLASVEQYVRTAEPLPLVLDDILINFDDERAAKALTILGNLSQLTQIIFFTHHQNIVTLAKQMLPESVISVHRL
ncbi:MAG: AAA family ATPase [Limnochordia bacterium]|nr:AAA family ATPase [Limnochordia bacterium]